jgi:phosphatidate cytidylyltransferase
MKDSFLRRAVVGTAFVLLVTGLTYVGGVAFLFLALAVVGIGMVEFTRIARGWGVAPFGMLGVLAGAAVTVCAFVWGPAGVGLAAGGGAVLCIAVGLGRRTGGAAGDGAATAAGVLYVAALGSHAVLLREGPGHAGMDYAAGFRAAMYAFVATWCCDTFAYVFGRAFGRHKMFPSVSPKKSWEGALAGLLGAVGGLAAANWALGGSMNGAGIVSLGLGAGIVAQLGDLLESKMKRLSGMKDSSNVLPGHGGVLDRFDGFLFVAPLVYYYFVLTGFAGV